MSHVTLWMIILVVGLGTFFLRSIFIFAMERFQQPESLNRLLRYLPAAILAALISSSLLVKDNQLAIDWQNERLIAGLVAGLVAWKTKNAALTITVGLVVFILLN